MQLSYGEFIDFFKPMKEIETNIILTDEEKKNFNRILSGCFSNEVYLSSALMNRLLQTKIIYLAKSSCDENHFIFDYEFNLDEIYISSVSNIPKETFVWNAFMKSFILHELSHKIQFLIFGYNYLKNLKNQYDYFQNPLERQSYFCQFSYIKEINLFSEMKEFLFFRNEEEKMFYKYLFSKIERRN